MWVLSTIKVLALAMSKPLSMIVVQTSTLISPLKNFNIAFSNSPFNRLDNLVTICNIDHLCFHLGFGGDARRYFLAVIPELTQAEITNLMRIYHCAVATGNRMCSRGSKACTRSWKAAPWTFSSAFSRLIFSNGHEIAVALSRLDDAAFAMRHKTMNGLRVIPTEAAFRQGQIVAI